MAPDESANIFKRISKKEYEVLIRGSCPEVHGDQKGGEEDPDVHEDAFCISFRVNGGTDLRRATTL
jgi:hypothetical protein